MLVVAVVAQIAEAYAHVAMQVVGDGDGYTETHDSVCEAEGVDVAVAQKEEARDSSPDEGDRRQDRVGQVGERKDCSGYGDRESPAGEKPEQAQKKIALQNELLHKGPYDVAASVEGERRIAVQRMQAAGAPGDEDGEAREYERDGYDPERGDETFAAKSK